MFYRLSFIDTRLQNKKHKKKNNQVSNFPTLADLFGKLEEFYHFEIVSRAEIRFLLKKNSAGRSSRLTWYNRWLLDVFCPDSGSREVNSSFSLSLSYFEVRRDRNLVLAILEQKKRKRDFILPSECFKVLFVKKYGWLFSVFIIQWTFERVIRNRNSE